MCSQMCASVASGRRVHLFPWGNNKMYTSGIIVEFTEDANWNKEKWSYRENKDLSGKWSCQILKAFRIISSEMTYPKVIMF